MGLSLSYLLINQSYINLPKGHAHLVGIPYRSPRSATMRSVAANGAERARASHGNCCFIYLSQIMMSEKREGPTHKPKPKDTKHTEPPKGGDPLEEMRHSPPAHALQHHLPRSPRRAHSLENEFILWRMSSFIRE